MYVSIILNPYYHFINCCKIYLWSSSKGISSSVYSRYESAEHAAVDFNEVFGCSVRATFHYSWLLPTPIK